MKCEKCGNTFPSRHHFKVAWICRDCYGKLSLDERHTADANKNFSLQRDNASVHTIKGNPLECPVCKHDRFWTRKTLLNTAGATFWGFDWANRQARNYVCESCGHILWFFTE
jgi:rubrerythrin